MTLAEHLNPLFTRHVTLETALSPSQCAERLRGDVASLLQFWGSPRQLRGRVADDGFSLHRFRGWHRSLPVEARGRFEQGAAGGRGTRIEVALGWRREDSIGTALGLAAGIFVFAFTGSAPEAPPAWVGWLFVPIVLVAVVVGGLTTLGEDEWMLKRLSMLLQATDVTAIS